MKHTFVYCILFLFCGFYSCQKIDLTEEKKPEGSADTGESGQHIPPEFDEAQCLTVAELSALEDNMATVVGGYIVGYIPAGSIKNTKFTSEQAVQSNIVIADDPKQTDCQRCAPMQLVKDTSARDDLNLVSHPENLGQFVVLYGVKNSYYKTSGLKPVIDYVFADPVQPSDSTGNSEQPSFRTFPILGKSMPYVLEGR